MMKFQAILLRLFWNTNRPNWETQEEILGFFKDSVTYEKFCLDQVSYAENLERIQHQLIEAY